MRWWYFIAFYLSRRHCDILCSWFATNAATRGSLSVHSCYSFFFILLSYLCFLLFLISFSYFPFFFLFPPGPNRSLVVCRQRYALTVRSARWCHSLFLFFPLNKDVCCLPLCGPPPRFCGVAPSPLASRHTRWHRRLLSRRVYTKHEIGRQGKASERDDALT